MGGENLLYFPLGAQERILRESRLSWDFERQNQPGEKFGVGMEAWEGKKFQAAQHGQSPEARANCEFKEINKIPE